MQLANVYIMFLKGGQVSVGCPESHKRLRASTRGLGETERGIECRLEGVR